MPSYSTNLSATLGNLIFMSTYIGLVLPITVTALISQFLPRTRPSPVVRSLLTVVYGAVVIIQLMNLLLAENRASLIGSGVALGFIGLMMIIVLKQRFSNWGAVWVRAVGMPLTGILLFSLIYSYHHGIVPKLAISFDPIAPVRKLVWDGSIQLMLPHRPLGIPGDAEAVVDRVNPIRPLVGYGPEMMSNAFAFSYPPELAQVETRGATVDRNHNETMDVWLNSGLLGVIAFYSWLICLIQTACTHLRFLPHPQTRGWWLTACLIGGALSGMLIAWGLDDEGNRFTLLLSLGLPYGLLGGLAGYLIGHSLSQTNRPQPDSDRPPWVDVRFVGLFAGFISYWVIAHFQFSIVSTYLYAWVYAGMLGALGQLTLATPDGTTATTRTEQRAAVVGHSYIVTLIIVICVFDFITPQFSFDWHDSGAMSLAWMFLVSWGLGLLLLLTRWPISGDTPRRWWRLFKSGIIYTSLVMGIGWLYRIGHQAFFGQFISVYNATDALYAANILVVAMGLFYSLVFMLMALFVVGLSSQSTGRFKLTSASTGLYITLLIASGTVIWFHNINAIRADIYLKEGERYRGQKYWDQAVLLHETATNLQPFEEFYHLMLALNYQLMAHDSHLTPQQLADAKHNGEAVALRARHLNPYNPDNTGNMGRYYFTLSQIDTAESSRQKHWQQARLYFEKAIHLAPTNMIYHNLLAQTWYMKEHYNEAIARLNIALTIDPTYKPTWTLLGDSYAAQGLVDEALAAHTQGMQPSSSLDADGIHSFADRTLDVRLTFYISAGRLEEVVAALQEVALQQPSQRATLEAIGRAYVLGEQLEQAIPCYEQAALLQQAEWSGLRRHYNPAHDYTAILEELYDQLESRP